MNLLLWGSEMWSLRKSQLDQLEVFLHRSIHWILQISMTKVQEECIWNERVCEMFYSILCVQNMTTAWQADFIGEMIHGPPNCPLWNMITACCNHKQQAGRPQIWRGKFHGRKFYVCYSKTLTQSTLFTLGICWIGFTKLLMRNTGTNWSNASSTLTGHCRSAQKQGGHSYHGAHNKLLAVGILPPTMKMAMRMVRTVATMATMSTMTTMTIMTTAWIG